MFSSLPIWLIWLIICGICLIVEIFTVSFMMLWPGIAAGIVALLSLLNIPIELQISIFSILTILSFIFIKPLTKKLFKSNDKVQTNIDSVIGKTGIVLKEIDGNMNPGQIKVLGELWSAISSSSDSIKEGETVIVTGIDGVKLIVKKS